MTIKKFNYHGQDREVIVTEEDDTSVKGYDISKIPEETVREGWRGLTKDIDMSKLTEEQQTAEYAKMKELMKHFRHFKKSAIQ